MRSTRFSSLTALSTSFRRSVSPSARSDHSIDSVVLSSPSSCCDNRDSYGSNAASPVSTINAIMHRRPSMLDLEEEKKSFASGLEMLEPRPIVYWGGLEERLGGL